MRGMHLIRRTHFFIEPAINAIAHAKFFFIRLDMNIAGVLMDSVIQQRIDQLDDRRLTGCFFEIAYIFGDIFDQRKIFKPLLVDDVVDDKNVLWRAYRPEGWP